MLSFNMLLEKAGISPNATRLLRHQDNDMVAGLSTYRLWRDNPAEFSRYERSQSNLKLVIGSHVASFVVDPGGADLFVAISRVTDVEKRAATDDVFSYLKNQRQDASGLRTIYQFERDPRFLPFEGRLVIDWGAAKLSWAQHADRNDKPIIELRPKVQDDEWPGFMGLRLSAQSVEAISPSWKSRLSAVNGVYLLVCPESGEQYVGIALGQGGFLARWQQYAADGHGGNQLLKKRLKRTQAPLDISILEVFGSITTRDEAFKAETRWKRALGTRAHGLNAN